MDAIDRLKMLTSQMHLEPAEDTGCPQILQRHQDDIYVSQAQLPNGQRISLLKTLLTNACERNCYYCPFRAGRDFRRATFKPEEMAHTFMAIHRTGIAEGIFLSSGVIRGGITTQDRLLDTADILRNRLHYRGYLHLKIMPGAERDQVLRAMQLADRVSVNLEAPNTHRLSLLAPRKQFLEELLQPSTPDLAGKMAFVCYTVRCGGSRRERFGAAFDDRAALRAASFKEGLLFPLSPGRRYTTGRTTTNLHFA